MKFVFIDKSEQEAQIIKNVLTKWNIAYHTNTNKQYGFFGNSCQYDIEINVEPAFYEFICKEVDKVNKLEQCFDMPSAVKGLSLKSSKQDKNWDDINKDMQLLFENVSRNIEKYDKRNKLLSKFKNILSKDKKVSKPVKNDKEQIIYFKDLTEEEKQILTLVIPMTVLKDPNTTFIRHNNGVSVRIQEK